MQIVGRTENAVGWGVLAVVAAMAVCLTFMGVFTPVYLGKAWSIEGTGEGVSLVLRNSGTAGVLYDLGVGGGLAVTQLGGRVMLWLSNAVVGSGTGESLVAGSNGVTTLNDFGNTTFANVGVSSPGLLTVTRTAPPTDTLQYLNVLATTATIVEYFVPLLQWAKRDAVTSDDGTTWTHLEAFGVVNMKFNATGYFNVWMSVPDILIADSAVGGVSGLTSVGVCYYNAFTFPPQVQLLTYSGVWPGGVPAIAWTMENTVTTPITCHFNVDGYVRLT